MSLKFEYLSDNVFLIETNLEYESGDNPGPKNQVLKISQEYL